MSKSETVTANQLRKNDVLVSGEKVEAIASVNGNQVCYCTNRRNNVVTSFGTLISRVIRTEAEIDADLDADDEAFERFCQENERRMYADPTYQLYSEDNEQRMK